MAERVSTYLERVKSFISQSAVFRTWVGAANAAAALAYIFCDELTAAEETTAGKYVLIDLIKAGRERAGNAFRGTFKTTGVQVVLYFFAIPTGDDAASERAKRGYIEDVTDDIMFDLETTVATDNNLAFMGYEMGPGMTSDEKADMFVMREVVAEFQ